MANKRKRKSAQAYDANINPLKRQALSSPLPEGIHHYQDIEEVPWDIQKYAWSFCVLRTSYLTYLDTGNKGIRSFQSMMKASG